MPVLANIVFVAGVLLAAGFDWRFRRVPNWLNVSLAVAGLVVSMNGNGLAGCLNAGISVGVGALLMTLPFVFGVYLGGDVKLVMALGCWLTPIKVIEVVAIGAILGGVLGLASMAVRARESRPGFKTASDTCASDASRVPMAVAFAASGILAFFGVEY